jgi:hypothetical protein
LYTHQVAGGRVDQQVVEVKVFLVTGFDGDVVMARGLMSSTAGPDSYLYWTLTDNSPVRAPASPGSAAMGPPASPGTAAMGPPASSPVLVTVLGDEPLIGRRLADRFRVTRDHGARVIIEP